MEIRLRADGTVMTEQEFRRLHPNTSLPRPLTEAVINALDADVVFEGPQATGGTRYQYSQRQGVEQVNGKWYTRYVLGPVFTDYTDSEGVLHTAAEQEAAYTAQKDEEQAKAVRAERGRKLAECDWVTLKAVDASNDGLGLQLPQVWVVYRQALRDITSQAGFPWEVQWPAQPE